MGKGLIFNQSPLGADSGLAQYSSIEGAPGLAWVEALAAGAAPRLGEGVASYVCRELNDTGPAAEAHATLMVVAFNVPEARIPEVEDWYEQEHIRLLMRAPGWLRARNYRVEALAGQPPWTHIALHELRDPSVMQSPERAAARSTEWRARLEAEDWFPKAGRFLYARL